MASDLVRPSLALARPPHCCAITFLLVSLRLTLSDPSPVARGLLTSSRPAVPIDPSLTQREFFSGKDLSL